MTAPTPDTWIAPSGLTPPETARPATETRQEPEPVHSPTSEDWVPYEPWMRDLLADDARIHCQWSEVGHGGTGLLIHPDDVPERPAEDDPDEALAKVLRATFYGDAAGRWDRLDDDARSHWFPLARAAREHIEAEREVGEPAPADDGLAEWERELLRPATCCGKCPPIAGGGYDCTCEGNPRCEKADTPEEWHAERDSWVPAEPLPWLEEHSRLQRFVYWVRGVGHCGKRGRSEEAGEA